MHRALGALERGGLTFKTASRGRRHLRRQDRQAEARIAWSASARAVHDRIRGLSPFPGAWCEIGGERVKVLRSALVAAAGAPGTVLDGALTIACAEGAVRLVEVQRAGGKPMSADAFLRGMAVAPGSVLG